MRRLHVFLTVSVSAVIVAACAGGSGSGPIAGVPMASSGPMAGTPGERLQSELHLLHHRRTPALPPPRRNPITGVARTRARAAGWQELTPGSPFDSNGPGTELLMTDGTVMVQDSCSPNWFSLAPDKNGSYLNGTWTEKASMSASYGPLYFASAVLADGKLIINGGEYNFCNPVETTLGAIYDPVANTWTPVSPPSGWGRIGDAQSTVLDNGTYMLGNCCTNVQALLNESKMTWTQVGNGKQDDNSEEGWTLLRGGNVLTVNVLDPPDAQVYVPKANMWEAAGQLPVNIINDVEIGPQTLLPNDTVFVAGANGDTVVYNAKHGSWAQGPTFPLLNGVQLEVADGPSTLLTDGSVILPASPGVYQTPAPFFIYNGKKLKSVAAPPNYVNDSTYNIRLLMLPTGQVLENDGSPDIEIYTSNRSAVGGIGPVISLLPTTLTHGKTYEIAGRRFNGLSQANMYGDDDQQATNYPLVRIVNGKTGHVFYCRTHGHSFMGVGSNHMVSTMFDVPSGIETGASTLVVVANGIASAPANVTVN
jgi:hypothetical protein